MKTYSNEEKEFLKCHSYVEDVIGSHLHELCVCRCLSHSQLINSFDVL